VFDPKKRITVGEALEHPYLEGLHIEDDEPTREKVNQLEFEFESHRLNGEQLKGERFYFGLSWWFLDLIYEEILLYHFPERLKEHNDRLSKGQSIMTDVLENIHASRVYEDDADDYDENGLWCDIAQIKFKQS